MIVGIYQYDKSARARDYNDKFAVLIKGQLREVKRLRPYPGRRPGTVEDRTFSNAAEFITSASITSFKLEIQYGD